jgi:hypothetical protein
MNVFCFYQYDTEKPEGAKGFRGAMIPFLCVPNEKPLVVAVFSQLAIRDLCL